MTVTNETPAQGPDPGAGESVRERAQRRAVDSSALKPSAAPRLSRLDTGESTRERAARRTVDPPPARAAERAVAPLPAVAAPAATLPRRGGVALLVLLLALLAGSFAVGRWTAREPVVAVEVPVVRGEDLSTASNLLQELGLRTVLAPAVFDAEIPRNAVISSNPPAGTTLSSGGIATITYSSGPEPVIVPPLAGQPEDSARDALSQVGLTPGLRVEEASAQVAAGSVVRLEPAAGEELPPGSTVTLVLSSGPPPLVLARVIGLSETEAEEQLTGAGLQVEIEREADPEVPEGRVIDQSPAPGTLANPGTAVVLRVSSG